jgi:hypothetical protein
MRVPTFLLIVLFSAAGVAACASSSRPPASRGAIGDVTSVHAYASVVELLASATATNGAPSAANGIDAALSRAFGYGVQPKKMRVAVRSTAGSGTMTVSLRLWMRIGGVGWVVAAALNGASPIAETGTDSIAYSEAVDVLDGADRYYLEITAIAGTSTAVTGYLVVTRP